MNENEKTSKVRSKEKHVAIAKERAAALDRKRQTILRAITPGTATPLSVRQVQDLAKP